MSIAGIALVAKPWRGGLADYLEIALEQRFPGRVQRLSTYPMSPSEKLAYRLSKHAWRMRLVERIAALQADVILFVNLLSEFIVLPRRPGHVLWLTDNPEPVLQYLDPFARVYVSDPGYAEAVLSAIGAVRFAGVLPFACQPDVHVPAAPVVRAEGFCFIANRDAKRDRVLRYLFAREHRVHVYGNYFLRHPLFWRYPAWFHPPVACAHMGAVYARHLASLNVHADVVKAGTNMRTFECAAYGVPQIVEYRPGLEDYFDIARELYVYREESELADVMDDVKACPDEARRRALRARERALDEHTYRQRIEHILQEVQR